MSENLLIALITGLISFAGSAGFWQWRKDRKQAPIHERDAALAAAQVSQQMALANAEAADNRSKQLAEDVAELRKSVETEVRRRQELAARFESTAETQDQKIQEQGRLITELRDVVQVLSTAWDDLIDRWHEVRKHEDPPPKPRISL